VGTPTSSATVITEYRLLTLQNKSDMDRAAGSRSQSLGRLSREAPRVVKLKDWNGATRSHRPQNAVALAWSANAAMHGRIEEYSTLGAATRWRLRFGAVPCEQLRADF